MMTEFVALRSKTCSYVTSNGCAHNKAKGRKKCIIKREIKFEDYKNCLDNNKTILRSQQMFRSKLHNVFMEMVKKVALSANEDKRIQTPDGVITHPLTYHWTIVCRTELLKHLKTKKLNILVNFDEVEEQKNKVYSDPKFLTLHTEY